MVVKFHGKKLVGEATVSQRAFLAKLEGKTNYGQYISKANASARIEKALAKGKKIHDGKTVKVAVKFSEATIAQRCLLAKLEGRTNYGQKISFEEATKRIAKLIRK